MGLEPTNGGTTNRCLNHLATLAMKYYFEYSNIETRRIVNPVTENDEQVQALAN